MATWSKDSGFQFAAIYRSGHRHALHRPCSAPASCRRPRITQFGNSEQVVCRARYKRGHLGFRFSDESALPHPAHRLEPAEYLFDSFSFSLADPASLGARRPVVESRRSSRDRPCRPPPSWDESGACGHGGASHRHNSFFNGQWRSRKSGFRRRTPVTSRGLGLELRHWSPTRATSPSCTGAALPTYRVSELSLELANASEASPRGSVVAIRRRADRGIARSCSPSAECWRSDR